MFVKMGQILANRSEILPQRFCDELRRLRTDVEPVPFWVIRDCLEAEYGRKTAEVFEWIDRKPLGSASLAQVHRARLLTGEDVAVKVQRPGAQQVMAQDIDIMRSIVRTASRFVKTDQFVDLQGVVEELWQSFREETNFLMEARNLDDFYTFHKDTRGISCPRSYLQYCTEHIVVMDYIDGISIADPLRLSEAGYSLEKIGARIVEDYSTQVLDDGFFHAVYHFKKMLRTPEASSGEINRLGHCPGVYSVFLAYLISTPSLITVRESAVRPFINSVSVKSIVCPFPMLFPFRNRMLPVLSHCSYRRVAMFIDSAVPSSFSETPWVCPDIPGTGSTQSPVR